MIKSLDTKIDFISVIISIVRQCFSVLFVFPSIANCKLMRWREENWRKKENIYDNLLRNPHEASFLRVYICVCVCVYARDSNTIFQSSQSYNVHQSRIFLSLIHSQWSPTQSSTRSFSRWVSLERMINQYFGDIYTVSVVLILI